MTTAQSSLPGHELVNAGLADLAAGLETEAALVVAMAAPRLQALGRPPVDAARIREFAHRLGRVAAGRTRIYLTGGATAVLDGWRASTIDVDVRFEPESDALLRELVFLKDWLGINVELGVAARLHP